MKKSLIRFTMIIPLAMLLCFLISCQNQAAKAELEEMKAQAEIEAQNKALVQRILEEGDKKNLDILDEVCTSDYKYRFPSTAEPINLEEHKELWQTFNAAFPDLTHTIDEFIAEEDMVVAREILRGTHKGEFMGIAPTGKKVEFSAIAIYRFSNGKFAEFWADADLLGLYQQLGMELKPKEAEK